MELKEVQEVLREEQNDLTSTGAIIAYGIDHFGLTLEEITDYASRTGLTGASVIEILTDAERKGQSIEETKNSLKEYVEKTEAKTIEEERQQLQKESAAGYLQEFVDGIAASMNSPVIRSGFPTLDQVLDGGLYSGLYVVGAITSLGKTTLIMQMADQIAAQGNDVIIFAMEMPKEDLISKSVSRLTMLKAGMDNAKTARGITDGSRYKNYSEQERQLIKSAIKEYGTYAEHIFIYEGIGDIGVNQIREAVERHTRILGNIPVVVVDYVQILAPYDIKASDKQNIDKAVLELKRISRDFKSPVIAISSFNRAGYKTKADFSGFKESGSLEYGSDVVIGLDLAGIGEADFDPTEAKSKDLREIEAVILKNRNGRTGDRIKYQYYPRFNYFKEADRCR